MVDFLILNHFFRPQASSLALQRRFWVLQRYFREISRALSTLTHAVDRSEKAPEKDKN
jgi:hypothetical protein